MNTISVVIPTFNNGRYILDALQSVFAQSRPPHEIIVVDDGSTDQTADLLRPFSDRIRYIFQRNQGLAVARNVGLESSSGDYLTFLDGDDLWETDNLEVKMEVLGRSADIGGVFSDFSTFDASGVTHARGMRHIFPFFRRTGRELRDIFQEQYAFQKAGRQVDVYVGRIFDQLFLGNFILPTSMVFHRQRALDIGPFRSHMRTQQDYDYWLRFSRRYRLAYVEGSLVRYRRHQEQLTNFRNIERIFLTVEEIIGQYESDFVQRGLAGVFNRRKAELLANIGKMYIRKGMPGLARQKVEEALRRDPRLIELYIVYGLTLVPSRIITRLWSNR